MPATRCTGVASATHPYARGAPLARSCAAAIGGGIGAPSGAIARKACGPPRRRARPGRPRARSIARARERATRVGAPRAVMRKYTVGNGNPGSKTRILPTCASIRTRVRRAISSARTGPARSRSTTPHSTAPVIVSSSAIEPGPPVAGADELAARARRRSRSRSSPKSCCSAPARGNCFRAAEFGAHFLRAGVGFEVMDTGAACRTFNVLVAEQRRVVALLIP